MTLVIKTVRRNERVDHHIGTIQHLTGKNRPTGLIQDVYKRQRLHLSLCLRGQQPNRNSAIRVNMGAKSTGYKNTGQRFGRLSGGMQ